MKLLPFLLLSVASVLPVRCPAQVVVQPPGIRVVLAGPGITVNTNGFTRTISAPGAAGDITGGAVTGGLLTVGEAGGVLTFGLSTNAVRSAVAGIYLPMSGGTMTGAINMGQANITYAGALGLYDGSSMPNTGEISLEGNIPTWTFSGNSHTIWHSGNDGSVSQLDAGLFGGQRGAYYLDAANLTNTASVAHGGTTSGNLSGTTTLAELADVVDSLSPGGGASSFSFHACRWVGPKATEYTTWSIKSYAAPGYVYGLAVGFVGLASQSAGTMESQFTIPAGVTQWSASAAVSLRVIGDSTSSGAVKYQLWILEAGSGDIVYNSGPNQVVSSVDAATVISLGAADIAGSPSPGETYIVRIEAGVTTSGFYVFGTPLIQVVP